MPESRVPAAATVRLDASSRQGIGDYMERTGMTFSQAVRVLVALALREEGQNADMAFRAAVFREGITSGEAVLLERLQTAVQDIRTQMAGRR